VTKLYQSFLRIAHAIPDALISLLARISIAAIFWQSGQTKIEGFVVNLLTGEINLGMPTMSESTIALFQEEYKLPILPPELAAYLATIAEHVFPVLLLVGLATRLSATALLIMTAVIQIFVYPTAYPTHGVWAVALLFLIAKGPGWLAIDNFLGRQKM
jgi:putative oxidoreductase